MLQRLSKFIRKSPLIIRNIKFVSMNNHIVPINDLDKYTRVSYDKEEKELRCKLASVYRLVYLNDWTSGIYNHITARLSNESNKFLINPFGLLYSEVTASNLIKIDDNCKIVDNGSSNYGVNRAGFTLHSAIHAARSDINFIIHVHTRQAAAISALTCGLLPISQEAMICGDVSYHEYGGIVIDEQMKLKIAQDLGEKNLIMILKNHGVVVCGETVVEAWHYLYNFMYACEIQLSVQQGQLCMPNEKAIEQVKQITRKGGGGVNVSQYGIEWKLGELEFEAEMRRLDSMGYQTGYPYRCLQTS